jgi:hypothetical protein
MIGLPKHAVLACLTRCLGTVLRRLRGQVDNAQGDSKMRRQREMQGWPRTRVPKSDASLTQFAGNCTPARTQDATMTAAAFSIVFEYFPSRASAT